MKRKSRHKRHIELLKKLVQGTDYYIAHVWDEHGKSMHGKLDWKGRQRFIRFGDWTRDWYTPWLWPCNSGKVYFALQPKPDKNQTFGLVITGWKELTWFVNEGVKNKSDYEEL